MSGEANSAYASRYYAFSLRSGINRALRAGDAGRYFLRAELEYRQRLAQLVAKISAVVDAARTKDGLPIDEYWLGGQPLRRSVEIESSRRPDRRERFFLYLAKTGAFPMAARKQLAARLEDVVWGGSKTRGSRRNASKTLVEVEPIRRRSTRFAMEVHPTINIVDAAHLSEFRRRLEKLTDDFQTAIEAEVERLIVDRGDALGGIEIGTLPDALPDDDGALRVGIMTAQGSAYLRIAASFSDRRAAEEALHNRFFGLFHN